MNNARKLPASVRQVNFNHLDYLKKEIQRLEKKNKPYNKNTAQKLKYLENKYRLEWLAMKRKKLSGSAIRTGVAAKLLHLREMRAIRAIAKALSSNAVMKRIQNRRRHRNFTREELSLYPVNRNTGMIRPSTVKSRVIIF